MQANQPTSLTFTLAGATGRLRGLAPLLLMRLFRSLERVGDHVDIAALRARCPEVGWLSFEGWAERQDWRTLARGPRAA